MCACEKGHVEAALVLYQWDRRSVDLRDNEGRSAPDIALANGFANIGKEIQRLESTFAMELSVHDLKILFRYFNCQGSIGNLETLKLSGEISHAA